MGWRIALACRQPRPEPASLLQTSTSGRAFTAVEPQRYPAIRTQAAEVSQDEVPESTAGIAPYSCGVISTPGYEVVHVTLHGPLPYRDGFDLIERHLASEDRPRTALCGIELRSPRPFSFEGFARFNEG